MDLYNDLNKKTTVSGLGFKNEKIAKESIKKIYTYFNDLYSKQKIPGYSSKRTLPRKYLENDSQARSYYRTQIMYRILAMRNRAKSMVERINNTKDIKKAIKVFDQYL